jgi:transglutaminase-like putative cysteine protease
MSIPRIDPYCAVRTEEPLERFLEPAQFIESDAAEIRAFVAAQLAGCDDVESARRVFHFVRDDVSHSWDIQGKRVTRTALDVLTYREGICYAKSHLAAALLRSAGIPTGICYQRLTLMDDDSRGYAVHALNTVYLQSRQRWIRFDARGNKQGVDAQFSVEREQLAFRIRPQFDEVDYLVNHAEPHPAIVDTLSKHDDAITMYVNGLPSALDYGV